MAIEEIECLLNRIRSYFWIISVHGTIAVRGCNGEVFPDVPAMCRVFVDHQLDWSSFILLHLEPRYAILRWSLGVEVAHLHQKWHRDFLVGHKIDIPRRAARNSEVADEADRIVCNDCAEGWLALWRLVKARRNP